jgi:site-specific DNA recombinase
MALPSTAPSGSEGRVVLKDGNTTKLAVHEPEAAIVRLIFEWYVQGDGESSPLSMSAIAKRLTDLGVPTCVDVRPEAHLNNKKRAKGNWGYTSVGHILNNEIYLGTWYYGRGRGDSHPRDEWIEVPVPAIVDIGLWEKARSRRRENKQLAARNRKYNYLLSGRLRCGLCGALASGSTKVWTGKNSEGSVRYYRCCTAFSKIRKAAYGLSCSAPNFSADQVDAAIWESIKSFLTVPDELIRGLKHYQRELDAESAPIRERLKVVQDLINENKAQLERLLDLYLAGNFPKEMLTDRQERLEATVRALQKERLSLVAFVEARTLSDEQIQSIQAFASEVAAGLSLAEADPDVQRRIIEQLDVQATLAIEDGQKVVYVRWLLDEFTTLPIAHARLQDSGSAGSGRSGRRL